MAAPYNPPVKNQDLVFFTGLEDFANPGKFKDNPTLAAGDVKVYKDGVLAGNITTLPSAMPVGSQLVMVTISATEKNCDNVTVVFRDQTVPPEWAERIHNISTTTLLIAQTGDSYARLGAPAGVSIAADLLTIASYIDTEITSILARLPAALTGDGNMKVDALRVGGTLQTAGDLVALLTTLSARLPAALTGAGFIKADTLAVAGETLEGSGIEGSDEWRPV